jgi:uncharacterized RDD family membrane protein YckC
MSRAIRNARAQQLQGQRAGLASRALAAAIDVGIAFLIYLAIVAAVNLAWDVFLSQRIAIPTPPGWVSATASFAILILYWTLGWGSTGRTFGKQMMGIRVVRADATLLRPRGAFLRAVLCAVFYPGLALALVHRRNQSLQDLACKTVVVYDWVPESGRPRVIPRRSPPSDPSPEALA